ncbi:MAG: AAA family ATPase, partial [Nitrospirae bacterium]|nr:AAA family ATPase [Nitrospirota bacterium]
MKIISLRLKNINSFRGDVNLDFTSEPLCSTSLFAITGPTGSGKTTLLDAISVALYNKTPRLNGTGNSNPNNLLNQGANEGFSELTFKVNDIP